MGAAAAGGCSPTENGSPRRPAVFVLGGPPCPMHIDNLKLSLSNDTVASVRDVQTKKGTLRTLKNLSPSNPPVLLRVF